MTKWRVQFSNGESLEDHFPGGYSINDVQEIARNRYGDGVVSAYPLSDIDHGGGGGSTGPMVEGGSGCILLVLALGFIGLLVLSGGQKDDSRQQRSYAPVVEHVA